MPKKIVITANAKADISSILRSVGEYTGSTISMIKLRDEFLEKFDYISYLPKGAKLLDDGNRQTFCRRYRIIYHEFDNEVHILTVIHSLRKYP